MTERPRIVITGLGGICSLGCDAPTIWRAMTEGRDGIGPIETVPLHDLKVRIGGEIAELPDTGLERRQLVTMDRFSRLATIAAGEALGHACVDMERMNRSRIGAVIGTGVCGWEAIEESYRAVFLAGKSRANVFTVPRVMPGAAAGQVSMVHGLRGPVFGVTSACSSSNHAFAAAADQLRAGRADVMLAGGSDAPLVYGVLKAWEALRVLAREACRPFSADREGLVLGEGAGVAVLETYEHARARGAPILAELAGVGMSADASDIVAPTLEGPVSAMRACLDDAGLANDEIDYVNAHGTATKANDLIETRAIQTVFGNHSGALSVSSTKSMHAHCLGASGALEMIACVMAVREGIVPPTIGYREADPDCPLDVTANTARERPVRAALSNAFAFGGTNAVIAVKQI
ncbi:beta-ketoacyl-[acyl-carrier-protein] synthase family protein [Nitratireductor mangrovi]|uniref:Nodulation protein E n=1 Tax=Nitratireductor mangrovi TaxID=2599600 RepID=A0A5B8KWP4_9HYPH|nr:beta-ketoacyl-[acyl-carrier-protein] synthase family protein [Nitratireductor mangrovi]QDZ00137.1 beta-ketoacyl-[acyl-carrier-protein] synthase family protein [Nitratireductor mangrovi]